MENSNEDGRLNAASTTKISAGRKVWRIFYFVLHKKEPLGFVFVIGAQDETRTHNPVKEADFKSAAYTNSATWANFILKNGGAYQSCTGLRGFADLCVTAPPTRHGIIIAWILARSHKRQRIATLVFFVNKNIPKEPGSIFVSFYKMTKLFEVAPATSQLAVRTAYTFILPKANYSSTLIFRFFMLSFFEVLQR